MVSGQLHPPPRRPRPAILSAPERTTSHQRAPSPPNPRTPKTPEEQAKALQAKLPNIRERKDLTLPPTPYLKPTFRDFDGGVRDLTLRYYQIQGILHLLLMRRFLLGDDTGLGKTIQSIAALCYIWEREPERKAIVLTTKSATPQWAKEFGKFTQGVRVLLAQGPPKKRQAAYEAWRQGSKPSVLIMGYRSAVGDLRHLQEDHGYILITDEATAYKNTETQIHQVVNFMGKQADRVWALTATLLKNHLLEGHGIYSVVIPGLFGSLNNFRNYFCIVEMMQIGAGRKVPRIVGYYPERVAEFRDLIRPYYLGRPKHLVATELPALIRDTHDVVMSPAQQTKYKEALSGLLEVGEKRAHGSEEKEVTKLTALIYCQQIANHPALIECEGESTKLEALLELLTEGDLASEKVIVYTRFKKMIDILMPALQKAGLEPRRVTGDESGPQRQAAQDAFQDTKHPCRVICITSAGGEGINLQAAKAIIFYDTPWSAGDYLQVLGRMIRIGSRHDSVYAVHMVSRCPGAESIDARVLGVIGTKMKLIESVLGERLKGNAAMVGGGEEGTILELFNAMKAGDGSDGDE